MNSVERSVFGGHMFPSARALLIAFVGLTVSGCSSEKDTSAELGSGVSGGEVESMPVRCVDCGLDAVVKGVLFDPDPPASIAEDVAFRPCSVAAASDTTFAVGRVVGGGALHVFGPGGELQETVGGLGQGPGEFSGDLRLLPIAGGGLVVLDRRQTRATLYGDAWKRERVVRLPVRPDAQTLSGASQVVLHARPSPDAQGLIDRFLTVDLATGETARLVGGVQVHSSPRLREFDQWLIEDAGAYGLVAAPIWRYELSFLGPDGEPFSRMRRDAAWAPDTEPTEDLLVGIYSDRPPPPTVASIQYVPDRILRVFLLVPDQHWTPNQLRLPTPEWGQTNFDTVIEVLDLEGRAIVASGRFDEVLAPVCGSHLVFRSERTRGGDVQITLLELNPSL